MAISTAVPTSAISRILGYAIKKGNFNNNTRNLPQRIIVLGEANTANQGTLSTDPKEVTSASEAASLYGFGSPIHSAMRILRPTQGGGVGVIPTVVIPQDEAGSAVAAARTITVTGTATGTATHYVNINGREGIDGKLYAFDVVKGDTATEVAAKINTVINSVTAAPAASTVSTTVATVTTKWAGVTSEELVVAVDNQGESVGMTYTIASSATGSGTVDISGAMAAIGSEWSTIIVNPYTASAFLDTLETTNGTPSATNPTGRYGALTFKPFVALFGSKAVDLSEATAITDARSAEVTNVACPAPGSSGFTWEAAANVAAIMAPIFNDTPQSDVSGQAYPDMPTPTTLGDFASYTTRDAVVKVGHSTVDLVAGKYEIQDMVTTYHPAGEEPAQYRYPRNLNIDWNFKFGLYILEKLFVLDKVIVADSDTVSAANTIKPKEWKGIVGDYLANLVQRALIADLAFSKENLAVQIGDDNPDRLETFNRYKRTGTARILSSTSEAGFNTGTN